MISIGQHKNFLHSCKNLHNLKGPSNARRRVLKRLYDVQNGKCMWCGDDVFLWWTKTAEEFKQEDLNKQATFEHLTLKSKGGAYSKENGGCACADCNTNRANISFGSFKYVTANKERYDKWKRNQVHIVRRNQKASRELEHRMVQFLQNQKRQRERQVSIFNLACMFMQYNRLVNVDLYEQFVYHQTIIKRLGVHYGLL